MYSFCPSRYTTRSTITSEKSISRRRFELSKTNFTLARFCRGSAGVPPQIMSSPFLPRIDFIDCSPRTNRKPSATLLLPLPFGPTIEAMAEVKMSCVFLPNDLKPVSSIDFKYIRSIVYQKILPFISFPAPLLAVPFQRLPARPLVWTAHPPARFFRIREKRRRQIRSEERRVGKE